MPRLTFPYSQTVPDLFIIAEMFHSMRLLMSQWRTFWILQPVATDRSNPPAMSHLRIRRVIRHSSVANGWRNAFRFRRRQKMDIDEAFGRCGLHIGTSKKQLPGFASQPVNASFARAVSVE